MLEDHADLLQVAFAETSGDEDLNAHGEAHGQRGEHEIEQTGHHGGTQLDGAQMPQESRVGEGDDGLRQVSQHDGVGDAPDLSVGDGGFHGAKVREFDEMIIIVCTFASSNSNNLHCNEIF